ncbi:hypothetical protein BGZ93_007807 [Podila epicladia]|nr:hypothetical protein BGZ93_007807 [Podila epicladia]
MRIKLLDSDSLQDDGPENNTPSAQQGTVAGVGASTPTSPRSRRRVSRANSAKGFISFKPARSSRTDISQKHLVAKSAIEHAFTDYMECLNRGIESIDMDCLLRIAFQASEPVAVFLSSIEDISKRVSMQQQWDVKELTAFRAQLATTLNDLFGVIQDIKGDLRNPFTAQSHLVECVLTKLMAYTSDLLRSLIDMERLFRTPTPAMTQPRPKDPSEIASGTPCTDMITTVGGPEQDERSRNASEWRPSELTEARFATNDTTREQSSPELTPSPEAPPSNPACNVMNLRRKFVSLSALNSHYKSHTVPIQRSDSLPLNIDSMYGASYGDAYDFESHASVPSRQGHDSAVVLMNLTTEQNLQPQQDPLKVRPADGIRGRPSPMMTSDQIVLGSESNSKESIPWAEQLQKDFDSIACRKRRSTDASAFDIRIASRLKSDGRSISALSPSPDATFPRLSKIPPPRSDSIISNLIIAAEGQQTGALPPLPRTPTSTASQKPSSLPTTIGGAKPRPISPAMQFHSLRSLPLSHSRSQPQKQNSRPLSRQSIQGKENSDSFPKLLHQSTISLNFSVRDSQYKECNNSWFLGNDYNEDEATFNENNQLTGATLGAYIELLTPHRTVADPTLISTFFITFRLFSTPSEVVSLLIRRFNLLPPAGLDIRQSKQWAQKKQDRIRQSVYTALRTWIDNYWMAEKDNEVLTALLAFTKCELLTVMPTQASRLLESLNLMQMNTSGLKTHTLCKARSCDYINLRRTQDYGTEHAGAGFGLRATPPAPSVNKSLLNALSNDRTLRTVPVTEIMPVELARQLTLFVSKMFLNIPYLELLTRDRPNCSKMAKTATEITTWIIETIVDQSDLKKRVEMIKHWIKVGEECLKLNNFDTLTAITCAIDSSPIHRLSATWDAITSEYCARFQQLQRMVSTKYNYREYRAKLKSTVGPCIPFLGLFLTAVTHIADGNAAFQEVDMPCAEDSNVASTKPMLIRYCRYHYLANTVQEFQRFQTRYELLLVPHLREYIVQCLQGLDWQRNIDKSNAIEPGTSSSIKGGMARNNTVSRGSTFGFFGSISNANPTNKNRNRGMTIFRRRTPQSDSALQASSVNGEAAVIKRTRKLDIFHPGPRK